MALGSNLGDRARHLDSERAGLRAGGFDWTLAGPVEETAPLGPVEQGAFLNQVLAAPLAAGTPSPEALLDVCLALETAAGRVRRERWGPRTLDVDIVLYGSRVIETPRLVVPHPEMPRRSFVIRPLAELLPDVVHPVLGRTLRDLARDLAG